ncbi:MAG: hypothetical protein EOO07_00340 [Chitinophagaceae bacterium]|nr:MAG: hypothetical protein EOO07_00340 [Chitinophagaceae bacterium]
MQLLAYILLKIETADFEKLGTLLAPILSACAFILSSAAFIFAVIIQLKERKRNIRQTLTTALSEVARINVEIAKVKNDNESSFHTIKILKNYHSQRGTLISDADFLISQNRKIVTDIDCELMASTYDDLGNNEKAEAYWLDAIKLSANSTQKHIHKRDYANFLFTNNAIEKARDNFESALTLELPDTDDNYAELVHTYLMWAKLAHDFGDGQEFSRLLKQADTACSKIRHQKKRVRMKKLVDKELGI